MVGHNPACGWPLCNCVSRIYSIFEAGGHLLGFEGYVVSRFRLLEAELRDELQRPLPVVTGTPPGPAAPPARPLVGEAKSSQKPPAEEAPKDVPKESALNLTTKCGPPAPPESLAPAAPASTAGKEKEEPQEDQKVTEKPNASAPASGASSSRPTREKEEEPERSPRHKGGRDPPRSRSKKKKARRSRSHSSRRRRRDRSRSGGERDREERKARDERTPELRYPPRHSGPIPAWGPRQPNYPPPRVPQGPGWRGVLPVSDHPRWTDSTNKGRVKRAKQEVFSSRRYRWGELGWLLKRQWWSWEGQRLWGPLDADPPR